MSIHDRATNERYSYLLACAEEAPEDTYEQAKALAIEIAHVANDILDRSRALNLPICNSDGIRNIEVAIYREIIANNPMSGELHTAEGFGAAMGNTDRDRVLRQAIRDRDFLKSMARV